MNKYKLKKLKKHEYMMKVGDLMASMGVNQKQIAGDLGVKQATVYYYLKQCDWWAPVKVKILGAARRSSSPFEFVPLDGMKNCGRMWKINDLIAAKIGTQEEIGRSCGVTQSIIHYYLTEGVFWAPVEVKILGRAVKSHSPFKFDPVEKKGES
jgi:DNA-binding transcriptional regulator LsrR (DeoR family)